MQPQMYVIMDGKHRGDTGYLLVGHTVEIDDVYYTVKEIHEFKNKHSKEVYSNVKFVMFMYYNEEMTKEAQAVREENTVVVYD